MNNQILNIDRIYKLPLLYSKKKVHNYSVSTLCRVLILISLIIKGIFYVKY
jgi:hypothetical protein